MVVTSRKSKTEEPNKYIAANLGLLEEQHTAAFDEEAKIATTYFLISSTGVPPALSSWRTLLTYSFR